MKKISISICVINILLLILLMNNIMHLNNLNSKGINDRIKENNNMANGENLQNNGNYIYL